MLVQLIQFTSTSCCHPHLSKQSCPRFVGISHASVAAPPSTPPPSPLRALGCWHIVTTMSACLLISLWVMFQSRYDRSNATRLNPNGSHRWGTKQQPSRIIIPMTAFCHEQHHMTLMTNTVGLWGTCLCTTGHNIGQWSTILYKDDQSYVLGLGVFFLGPVCLAQRQALCLWVFVKAGHALSVSRLRA